MACKLQESFQYLSIPRWLYEIDGLKPFDRELAAHILSYNSNGKSCYETNKELRERFDVGKGKVEGSIARLEELNILERTFTSNNRRDMRIKQEAALDHYIRTEYKKKRALPENQEPTVNSGGSSLPDNLDPTRKSETTLPENQDRATRNSGQTNNITNINYYQSIQQDTSFNKSIIEGADIWNEWEVWFRNVRRMRLPGMFMQYIRDNTDGTSTIGIRDVTAVFDKGYEPAIILEAAVEACNNTANPRTAMEETLAKRTEGSEQFQAKAADYLVVILEDAIDGFCRDKRIDTATFRQAVGNKYGIDYLRSNQA